MKYTWWILLTIAGILSLTSVYGFILCLGSFGMLALNVMWLFVYTPHKNSKALESISKPTNNFINHLGHMQYLYLCLSYFTS